MWIAGEAREGKEIDVISNPYDGIPLAEVAVAGPDEMDEAIASAASFERTARALPTHRRVELCTRTAQMIGSHADELATLMARESGKPIRFCRGEVARAQVTFTLGADAARHLGGEVMPIDLEARAEGRLCFYQRVARGPVAAISPFNFPLNLIAHKLSPAIAVGAPTVLKPPPQCPLTGLRLAELLASAGLPGEMLSVLHCPPEVAQRMVEDPRMKVLSFTGSDRVGWRLKSLAGHKQVLLELGGNAPCLIDETVEVGEVIDRVLTGAWANAGQVCIKVQRLFVHQSRYQELLAELVARTAEVRCGDPLDPDTVVGPLIDNTQVERVLAWIQEAVDGGATLHCGGTAAGNVVAPTVLTSVRPEMKVCKDEVFGPVTVVEPVADFEAGLAACNDTRFGLQAGVFTRDLSRAMRAMRELDYGGVVINDIPTFRVDNFPYGGVGDSGFGREGVEFAAREMSEPKVAIWNQLD
jgi:aldehyde dehydrogenase (NAD+)